MRRLQGWQAVIRSMPSGESLVVIHCFADAPEDLDVPIPAGLNLCGSFGHAVPDCSVQGARLQLRGASPWTACVLHLEADETQNGTLQ